MNLLGLHGVRAVGAPVGGAAPVGSAATWTARSRPGVLTDDRWTEGAPLGLAVLAVSGAVAGLAALLGIAGVGIAARVKILLGNPFSGAASAPRITPKPVGTIDRWLPPDEGGDAAALGVLLRRRRGGGPRPHVDPAGGAGPRPRCSSTARSGPARRAASPSRGGTSPSPSDRPPAGPSARRPVGRALPSVLHGDPEALTSAGSGRPLAERGDRAESPPPRAGRRAGRARRVAPGPRRGRGRRGAGRDGPWRRAHRRTPPGRSGRRSRSATARRGSCDVETFRVGRAGACAALPPRGTRVALRPSGLPAPAEGQVTDLDVRTADLVRPTPAPHGPAGGSARSSTGRGPRRSVPGG